MILPLDIDDLSLNIDIDVLGKFLMGIFFKWTGAWYEPRNDMVGELVDGRATYTVILNKDRVCNREKVYATYIVPTKEEVAKSFYPHSGEDVFNNKYLSPYAIYEFWFSDGSKLERNKAGGFRWL
jgi:hypothetical protein